MTDPTVPLPTPEALAAAYKSIDDRWADLDSASQPPHAADVVTAIADLAKAIGYDYDPKAQERENEYGALLTITRTLEQAVKQAALAEPGDPAIEYQRLLRLAEDEALRNPAAGEALAKIADRWLSDALVSARKNARPGTVIPFGSPQ